MAKESLHAAVKKKPGRPPGLTHVTQRNVRYVQKLFQEHAQEAMDVMLGIMRDDEADHAVKLKAANDILNRGFGTPVSTQVIMQLDEKDQVSPVSGAQIGVASTDELQSVLSTLQRFLESESKTVDVTPVVMPEGYPKA